MAPLGINGAVKELLIFNLTTQILLVRRGDEAQKTHFTAAFAVLAPHAKNYNRPLFHRPREKDTSACFFLLRTKLDYFGCLSASKGLSNMA